MKKPARIILLSTIALVIIFLILWPKIQDFRKNTTDKEELPTSRPSDQKLKVNAIIVGVKNLDNKIRVIGTVEANESLEVRSEYPGKITGIYFKEGERVPKGKLLVSIDDEEMEAELEKLKFSLQLLEEQENRERQLLERQAISQEEYDETLTELNKAKADIKLEQARLRKAKIVTPFSGVLGLRHISLGSYVNPSDIITTLYNINPAKVEFAVPGKYSDRICAGDKILFTTEASEEVFEGTVYVVEPRIDPDTRTLQVRAKSPNPDYKLLPGQYARVEVVMESQDSAILIPSEAVIPELGSHKVFVYRSGQVEEEEVNIGIRTKREIEILSGLKPGDTLITSGILQVRRGMKVEVLIITN
ncbi:efflux RND transporter periplasmic adaptor subunit [Xanthovirga aplysinae]|uniref:efflux RND transporter periplasmic adaptor subunit n=1 Tax=Xanthovirga aplysinae TaxID=2529853 RepID=UPI0012BC0DFD|nr:efflux RND transporter periplasmic adaptor subunit [Xanthovirga aplysinae]MTI33233.1 efflux RND transporter periplasmic adaptor subunit [Xanthovirga aplysinae]